MSQVRNGPSILTISPSSVSSGFTGPLTVDGSNFNSTSQVSVGSTLYTPNSQTSNKLVVNTINAVTASSPVQVHNGGSLSNQVTLQVT